MFPLIWRYLLSAYLKITFFTILAFIIILLTTRFEELAKFIALDAPLTLIGFFILFQVLYILPITIPIGTLIGSILLMQQLSKSHEIKAMRSLGMGLVHLTTPFMLGALLFCVVNFFAASEFSTVSNMQMHFMKSHLKEVNPFLILSSQELMHSKGFYYETMGGTTFAKSANDVLFAVPNGKKGKIQLLLADRLANDKESIIGEGITLFSPLEKDQIVIDHSDFMQIEQETLSKFIPVSSWAIKPQYLNFMQLISSFQLKHITKTQFVIELLRRLTLVIAPLTFTLLGIAFGMTISRTRSPIGLLVPVTLSSLFLVCYFTGNKHASTIPTALVLYFFSQVMIILSSFAAYQRISKGIE